MCLARSLFIKIQDWQISVVARTGIFILPINLDGCRWKYRFTGEAEANGGTGAKGIPFPCLLSLLSLSFWKICHQVLGPRLLVSQLKNPATPFVNRWKATCPTFLCTRNKIKQNATCRKFSDFRLSGIRQPTFCFRQMTICWHLLHHKYSFSTKKMMITKCFPN